MDLLRYVVDSQRRVVYSMSNLQCAMCNCGNLQVHILNKIASIEFTAVENTSFQMVEEAHLFLYCYGNFLSIVSKKKNYFHFSNRNNNLSIANASSFVIKTRS